MQQAPETGTKESAPVEAKPLDDVLAATPPSTKESAPAEAKPLDDVLASTPPSTKKSAPVDAKPLDDALAAMPFGGETAAKESAPVKEKALEVVAAAPATRAKPPVEEEEDEPDNEFAALAISKGLLRKRSPLLYSTMAGNKGFDPLNLASDNSLLLQYREAELKHGRLAMLASVGWVASELFHTQLCILLSMPTFLQLAANGEYEKAPSYLNGGLDLVSPSLWLVAGLFTTIAELFRLFATWEKPRSFTPGDLNFDPLSFMKNADDAEKAALALKEINNGRLAMIAISMFALKENLVDSAIVNQSPELFTQGPLSFAWNIPGLALQYTGLFSCTSGLVYCAENQDAYQAIMGGADTAAQAEYINAVVGSLFM